MIKQSGGDQASRKGRWPDWLLHHESNYLKHYYAGAPKTTLVAESRASQFSEASICSILGIRDVPLIKPQDLPSYLQRLQQENSVRALTIAFWLLHQPGRRGQISQLVGKSNLKKLMDWGYVTEIAEGVLTSQVDLYPCLGDYVFTDPLLARKYKDDHVYQLGTDSYALARVTPRRQGHAALDLCTGSGIHAIQSAHFYEESYAVDVNPRALQLAQINAQINGVHDRCRWLKGDLYAPVQGQKFDLITINPPFVPTPDEHMHIHRTGGESGEVISERAVAGLPQHLAEGGTFSMVLDFPIMRTSTYLQRLSRWLGAKKGWGIAVLNFGHHSIENYIKDHVDSSAPNYYELYERYLASYQRQGIYEVAWGNVFIRRLPAGHPGFAVERYMVNPYVAMEEFVEGWLQALTRFTPQWAPDWQTEKPRRTPWVQDLWLNHKGDKGIVEFSQAGWSNPLQLPGKAVRLLSMLNGRATLAAIAQRWAKRQKLGIEEAREEIRQTLITLGISLLWQ